MLRLGIRREHLSYILYSVEMMCCLVFVKHLCIFIICILLFFKILYANISFLLRCGIGGFNPQVTGCRLQITGCSLQVTNYKLQFTGLMLKKKF